MSTLIAAVVTASRWRLTEPPNFSSSVTDSEYIIVVCGLRHPPAPAPFPGTPFEVVVAATFTQTHQRLLSLV